MGKIIAVAGKGGVGKTTISALIILSLLRNGKTPLLAVDADPNMCLDAALGVQARSTVGGLREEVRGEAANHVGISKQELLELKIAESLVEADDFDLIAMGRPEGPGCYCYANSVLRDVLREMAGYYPYVVVDNEAGLENMSRRITPKVDALVIVGDPSKQGTQTIERIHTLVQEMGIEYNRLAVVVNRLRRMELPPELKALGNRVGAWYLGGLPDDPELAECNERGRSLLTIPPENMVAALVDDLTTSLIA